MQFSDRHFVLHGGSGRRRPAPQRTHRQSRLQFAFSERQRGASVGVSSGIDDVLRLEYELRGGCVRSAVQRGRRCTTTVSGSVGQYLRDQGELLVEFLGDGRRATGGRGIGGSGDRRIGGSGDRGMRGRGRIDRVVIPRSGATRDLDPATSLPPRPRSLASLGMTTRGPRRQRYGRDDSLLQRLARIRRRRATRR